MRTVPFELFVAALALLVLFAIAAILGGVALVIVWRRRQASRRALQRQVTELSDLANAITAIASSKLDEDALCHLVHEQVAQLTDAGNFQIGLFNGDGYDIRVRTLQGEMQSPVRYDMSAPGIVKWMRDTGQPLLVRDFQTEIEKLPARPSHPASNPPRSGVFVPMISGERIVGVIATQSMQPNAYDESHLRNLGIIANQAAAAINNARALRSERRRAQQLELVSEVTRQTQSALTTRQLVLKLSEAIATTFGYYTALICLIEPDGETITCSGLIEDREEHIPTRMGVGLVGKAARDRAVVIVDDVAQEPQYLPVATLPETRSEAVLPLIIDERVIGALDLQSSQVAAFRHDDRRFLEVLSQTVAVAIEESRLYELDLANQRIGQELSTAREIQKSFLPRHTPQVPGWEVAASWHSATQVGGDFYDFIPLRHKPERATRGGPAVQSGGVRVEITPAGTARVIGASEQVEPANGAPDAGTAADTYKYGVVIADVAGKGVPAAMFMGLARTLMRAVGFSGRPPAEALQRVNELIFADTRSELFVTMLYAHWFPDTAQIELSNAGHNPALLIENDGQVRPLPLPCLPLGVMEEISPKTLCLTLEPGEVLLMYTDGITDALNASDLEFGLDQLKAVSSAARDLPAEQIVEAIRQAVAAHTRGAQPTDDETLVVIKRLG